MEKILISGPVSAYTFEYEHKKYFFFGDYHHSMSGTCDQPCLDVDLEDFENIGVGDICYDVTRFIDKIIRDCKNRNCGVDIFLETSGFSYDIPGTDDFKAMIEHVGYIQKLHYVYSNCFYDVEFCPYINARFHHMDVRDIGYYADSFFYD